MSLAEGRAPRRTAGNRLSGLLEAEEEDEFYQTTYGGFTEVRRHRGPGPSRGPEGERNRGCPGVGRDPGAGVCGARRGCLGGPREPRGGGASPVGGDGDHRGDPGGSPRGVEGAGAGGCGAGGDAAALSPQESGDDEYRGDQSDSDDEVDSDFDIDEGEEPASDQDESEPKRRRRVVTKAYRVRAVGARGPRPCATGRTRAPC